jgi:CSLREA domain-containing protein
VSGRYSFAIRHAVFAAAVLAGLTGVSSLAQAQLGSIIIVDTTADTQAPDGHCSLREAIIASNNNSITDTCGPGTGDDAIDFALGSGNPQINITSALPAITAPVAINGGTGGATRIVLNGPGSGEGLRFNAAAFGSTVTGLVLQHFTTAIVVNTTRMVITGNYIGTDATGNAAAGNGVGISLAGSVDGSRIGGTTGTTPGGACTGDCNLISGNTTGVMLVGPVPGTAGCAIEGNYIGSNAAGTAAVPNGDGIFLATNGGTFPLAIGASTAGAGNLISGNSGTGLTLFTVASTARVLGNFIGTQADGVSALPNGGEGIKLSSSVHGAVIGGTAIGEANVVAYNAVGVHIGVFDDRNSVRGNSIHDNAGKGIQLDDRQTNTVSTPVITGFQLGTVTGTACAGCTVDVYSDGIDEGRTYHGATPADGEGNWSFTGTIPGPKVTVTATTAAGSTSEFSAPVAADTDGDGVVDVADNCTLVANPTQRDTNSDGYGNLCDPDFNGDGTVNINDFNRLKARLNITPVVDVDTDLDGNGAVNINDFNRLKSFLGKPPGPSGLHPNCPPTCP